MFHWQNIKAMLGAIKALQERVLSLTEEAQQNKIAYESQIDKLSTTIQQMKEKYADAKQKLKTMTAHNNRMHYFFGPKSSTIEMEVDNLSIKAEKKKMVEDMQRLENTDQMKLHPFFFFLEGAGGFNKCWCENKRTQELKTQLEYLQNDLRTKADVEKRLHKLQTKNQQLQIELDATKEELKQQKTLRKSLLKRNEKSDNLLNVLMSENDNLHNEMLTLKETTVKSSGVLKDISNRTVKERKNQTKTLKKKRQYSTKKIHQVPNPVLVFDASIPFTGEESSRSNCSPCLKKSKSIANLRFSSTVCVFVLFLTTGSISSPIYRYLSTIVCLLLKPTTSLRKAKQAYEFHKNRNLNFFNYKKPNYTMLFTEITHITSKPLLIVVHDVLSEIIQYSWFFCPKKSTLLNLTKKKVEILEFFSIQKFDLNRKKDIKNTTQKGTVLRRQKFKICIVKLYTCVHGFGKICDDKCTYQIRNENGQPYTA
ncbi:hypothetical protein RFI_22423 [Reticulomyxa filosa]|uniref:Uncharacterized protein n=1 Tax=Reticulomyxa filosa TaxID=46433 RepID=X6MLR8_RETFI|nr:hypothetical protein RFI_22423 [Reticulomyxa filosa]|eukprot:ETO14943.1 hypothetical protein RFI_22423 [Reticulomyxa filosa]